MLITFICKLFPEKITYRHIYMSVVERGNSSRQNDAYMYKYVCVCAVKCVFVCAN